MAKMIILRLLEGILLGGLTCESNVEALDLERGETLPDVEPPSFEALRKKR